MQYRAWEGLLQAACTSAEVQPAEMIRAISVSHRIDQLSASELHALVAFAGNLASDAGLMLETEDSDCRLTVRFYRPTPAAETSDEEVPFASVRRAVWQKLPLWRKAQG